MAPPSATVRPSPAGSERVEPALPPLDNGDRLTRAEFERRYEAMPQLKKAELIEGVVHMPSPVRLEQHGEPQMDLIGWLAVYRANTPGIRGGDNATVRLDMDNEPQPDGTLFIDPGWGGQAVIDRDGFLAAAPELAAEVSASSVSIDLGPKLQVYRRNQVREYLVWRVLDRAIDWYVLRQGTYQALAASSDGVLRSEILPGLWLDAPALLAGDLVRVHQVLQQGVASPEHEAFGQRLRSQRTP